MSFDTDISVRAAAAARAAAAQNPAPFWVVAAVPIDGQPWINVVHAFGREDDARARLSRLSSTPRSFAGVYASDGAGGLTVLDLWGPEYGIQQTRAKDTRGRYGVRAGADAGTAYKEPSWSKWVAFGAVAVGGYFLYRGAAKSMKHYTTLLDAHKTKHPELKKGMSEGAQNAYWDTYYAKHGYHE